MNEQMTIINPSDCEVFSHLYCVSLSPGGYMSESFLVFANHEQQALDTTVDYVDERGNHGFFLSEEEQREKEEDGEDGEEWTTAGNFCRALDPYSFSITLYEKRNTPSFQEQLERAIYEEAYGLWKKECEEELRNVYGYNPSQWEITEDGNAYGKNLDSISDLTPWSKSRHYIERKVLV